jgi:predicted DNA-binding ribbon-helix-helix protein
MELVKEKEILHGHLKSMFEEEQFLNVLQQIAKTHPEKSSPF